MKTPHPFVQESQQTESGYNFGTFGGVYTPALLTILGLVMFMRTNYVIGSAGTFWTLIILAVGTSITLSTGLSIATISTNTRVRGGGAYFLISRVLGPSFGTSIGLTLFLAQSLSIPFNILGATESVVTGFPLLREYYLHLTLGLGIFVFFVVWRGAIWAIKTQYVIMAILGLSILSLLIGPLTHCSAEHFQMNWEQPVGGLSLFACFALFFPAVTGIMAGVNMSGDLKDPHRSIPRGTLAALLTAVVIYILQIFVASSCFTLEEMAKNPYKILEENALFHFPWIILAGVLAATLSTAIGWMLGAPRVLQSLAQDGVLPFLQPFGVGDKATNEPRRAILLVLVITAAILVWGGLAGTESQSAEDSPINAIAGLVTLFFLFTYAIINLAAFVESLGSNPSFRPRFRFFHWSIALYGSLACMAVALLINFKLSIIGLAVITVLYAWIRYRRTEMVFGDARRGFIYAQVHRFLLSLPHLPLHPKNWRPTAVVFCRDPFRFGFLIDYAVLFSSRRGILSVIQIDEPQPGVPLRIQRMERLDGFRKLAVSRKWPVFPEVVVAENFDDTLRILLQGHSLDPIKPNIAILGWPKQNERLAPFFEHIRTIVNQFNLNCLILANGHPPAPSPGISPTIDLWFETSECGSLMLILAYLVCQNRYWRKADIRLFFAPENPLAKSMESVLEEARISAQIIKIPKGTSCNDMMMTYSRSAQLIFVELVRYATEDENTQLELHGMISRLDDTMPPVFLVAANGEADLFS